MKLGDLIDIVKAGGNPPSSDLKVAVVQLDELLTTAISTSYNALVLSAPPEEWVPALITKIGEGLCEDKDQEPVVTH